MSGRWSGERRARAALTFICEAGKPDLAQLVRQQGAEEVWQSLLASQEQGAWPKRARRLEIDQLLAAAERCGARLIMPGDGEWPERLDGLDHVEPLNGMAGSPIALWAVGPRDLGELCQSRLPAVAIVGARAATHYGCDSANELAAQLAGQFPVISGGAYGIDAAAHRGALSVGGPTVAVMAGGLDGWYPRGNSRLLDQIAGECVVVTEIPPGIRPTRQGFLQVGEQQGYFAKQGLKLDITPADSGPNIISSLAAGQYDLAYTAYAPALVAVAGGQDLRLVDHLDNVSAAGHNAGLLVKSDSPITRWKDLEGKKIGANAPRSQLVLWIQAAIKADGGDPGTLQIVPLPLNQIADNVAQGKLDAGSVTEPYLTQAHNSPALRDLGDPATAGFSQGTPSGGVFTSEKTLQAKSDVITKYRAAFAQTIDYANGHVDEVRAQGAKLVGLSDAAAKTITIDPISTDVKAQDFGPFVKALTELGWTKTDVDIERFLSR